MEYIDTVTATLKLEDGPHKGDFVLQQRSEKNKGFHYVCQGTWAGKMESGESPLDALRRECMEELGAEFCNNLNFARLTFIGEELWEVQGKNYRAYQYFGTITEASLSLAKLHTQALGEFLFINEQTQIFPFSEGKDPIKNIVLFDDHYRIVKRLFANGK